jgi:hypothetical protein
VNEGRKRIDILFNNSSEKGFFSRLVQLHKFLCPYVSVECKNYAEDPQNPELDQLQGRFSRKRGMVGFLVCRSVPEIEESARDLEVMYVGKGLSRSANDRMANHATLQKILAHIHSNEPDAEVFALAYAFQYRKNAISLLSVQAEIRGDAAKQRRQRALDYKPKLEEQVSLIEASVISYFRPDFNEHYLGFPDGKERILRGVYNADFAAILVQLDNTNIGGPRVYSKKVPPRAVHEIVVDFRQLEGKFSFFGKR